MLFWSAPLQILLAIYFLWRMFGFAVFTGIFLLIALIPLNAKLSVIMRNFQVIRKNQNLQENRGINTRKLWKKKSILLFF
jgi:hypothetical protein